ncbi:MAG: class II aldolase/adducin family protein [Sphingobium sp.]
MTHENHDEMDARRMLAACYRLIARFGMTDLVSTHISARIPGTETILINPYGLLFHEIIASNLVAVSLDGEPRDADAAAINPAGYLIHGAIHGAREDAACVIHTHSANGVALSCLTEGLLPISQHALQFHDRIAYHAYEGIALIEAEKARLVADLGHHRAMILRNHGLLTVGRTVAEAFILMFNLDRAAAIQIKAQAAGPITLVDPAIRELTARQHEGFGGQPVGGPEWSALLRDLARTDPDYID